MVHLVPFLYFVTVFSVYRRPVLFPDVRYYIRRSAYVPHYIRIWDIIFDFLVSYLYVQYTTSGCLVLYLRISGIISDFPVLYPDVQYTLSGFKVYYIRMPGIISGFLNLYPEVRYQIRISGIISVCPVSNPSVRIIFGSPVVRQYFRIPGSISNCYNGTW